MSDKPRSPNKKSKALRQSMQNLALGCIYLVLLLYVLRYALIHNEF